jgi:hypothetical protein
MLRALAVRPLAVRDLLAAVADEVAEAEAHQALAQLVDRGLVHLDSPHDAASRVPAAAEERTAPLPSVVRP